MRCATLTRRQRRRSFADEAHVCFLEVPQSHSTGAGQSSAPWSATVDVLVPEACPRVTRRTDRRRACATVDSGRDRHSDEVGPT